MPIRLKISALLSIAVMWHVTLANSLKPNDGYIKDFSCVGGQFSLRLPPDVRALSLLGPVLERRIGEVEEWGSYQTIRNYVRYPGTDLGYVTFSDQPQRYVISYVEVTDPNLQITGPFKVGDSVDAIRGIFGEAAKDDSGLNRSYGSEDGTVTFEQLNGIITKISYECYTG